MSTQFIDYAHSTGTGALVSWLLLPWKGDSLTVNGTLLYVKGLPQKALTYLLMNNGGGKKSLFQTLVFKETLWSICQMSVMKGNG